MAPRKKIGRDWAKEQKEKLRPNNQKGIILPEILTKQIVINNINKVKNDEN